MGTDGQDPDNSTCCWCERAEGRACTEVTQDSGDRAGKAPADTQGTGAGPPEKAAREASQASQSHWVGWGLLRLQWGPLLPGGTGRPTLRARQATWPVPGQHGGQACLGHQVSLRGPSVTKRE